MKLNFPCKYTKEDRSENLDLEEFWAFLIFQVRDKLNNMVLFDQATYDKLYKEVSRFFSKKNNNNYVSKILKVAIPES